MVHSEIGRKNSCLTGQGATISVRTGTCPKKKKIFFGRHQCASRKEFFCDTAALPEKILESLTCFQKTFWNILEHSGTPIWFPIVRSPNLGTSIDRAFNSSPCPTSYDEASYVHVHVPQWSSFLRDEIAGWATNAVGWLGRSHAKSRRNAEENTVCLRGSEGIIFWS